MVEHTAAEGDGPVNALDKALRKALERFYPSLKQVRLLDFKVRVIGGRAGTSAKVRVLVESGDKSDKWGNCRGFGKCDRGELARPRGQS